MLNSNLVKAASSYAQRVVGEGVLAPPAAGGGVESLADPTSRPAKRPRVQGLVQPRRPRAAFSPADLGRQKGTVPSNPFSGNWQKVQNSTKLVPPSVKLGGTLRSASTFARDQLVKHPIRTAVIGALAAKAPAIYRAARDGVTDDKPAVSRPGALAALGVMRQVRR